MTENLFILTILIALSCFAIERGFPGWPLPKVKTWPFRVILLNALQIGIIQLAGQTWEKWFNSYSRLLS